MIIFRDLPLAGNDIGKENMQVCGGKITAYIN